LSWLSLGLGAKEYLQDEAPIAAGKKLLTDSIIEKKIVVWSIFQISGASLKSFFVD